MVSSSCIGSPGSKTTKETRHLCGLAAQRSPKAEPSPRPDSITWLHSSEKTTFIPSLHRPEHPSLTASILRATKIT